MSISLTLKKKEKIRRLAKRLVTKCKIQIQDLATFIGNLVAADPGVYGGPLYYKGLEIERNEALANHRGDYLAKIVLSTSARRDIQWWYDNILTASKICYH